MRQLPSGYIDSSYPGLARDGWINADDSLSFAFSSQFYWADNKTEDMAEAAFQTFGTAAQLAGWLYDYVKAVCGADEERNSTLYKIFQVTSVLAFIERAIDESSDDKWLESIRTLARVDGPLCRCKTEIEKIRKKLETKLQSKKLDERLKAMTWPLVRKDVASLVDNLVRLEQDIHINVNLSQFRLSNVMHLQLKEVNLKLEQNVQLTMDCVQSISQVYHINSTIMAGTTVLVGQELHRRAKEIAEWLSNSDPMKEQDDIIGNPYRVKSSWLLQSDDFKQWKEGAVPSLHFSGGPGVGKTCVAANVIHHLQQLDHEYEKLDRPVIFLYCNHSIRSEQNAKEMLQILLKQLVMFDWGIPLTIQTLYNRCKQSTASRRRPEEQELLETLRSTFAIFDKIFVVVDTLDESEWASFKKLLEFLHSAQQKHTVKIFTTARELDQTETALKPAQIIRTPECSDDIISYIRSRFSSMCRFVIDDNELQEAIVEAVLIASHGK